VRNTKTGLLLDSLLDQFGISPRSKNSTSISFRLSRGSLQKLHFFLHLSNDLSQHAQISEYSSLFIVEEVDGLYLDCRNALIWGLRDPTVYLYIASLVITSQVYSLFQNALSDNLNVAICRLGVTQAADRKSSTLKLGFVFPVLNRLLYQTEFSGENVLYDGSRALD